MGITMKMDILERDLPAGRDVPDGANPIRK